MLPTGGYRYFFGAVAAVFLVVQAFCAGVSVGPNVADQFYPGDPAQLSAAVEQYLKEAAPKKFEGELLGALVPHAGYIYSGRIAAMTFKALEGRQFSTVILVGSGHYMKVRGAATIAQGSLKTPLGAVSVNAELVRELVKMTPLIEDNPKAFEREHSIEAELPFLQKILGQFSLVPLLMNNFDPAVAEKIGKAVALIAKSSSTLLLVSTDFSHYPHKDLADRADRSVLGALGPALEDPWYFWMASRSVLERGGTDLQTTGCGEAGLLMALYAFKEMGANRVTTLAYANSGSLPHGDLARTVGYAAVVWSRAKTPAPAEPALARQERKILLSLARRSIENYLAKKEEPKPKLWDNPVFNLPANVFVTLKRRGLPPGQALRGCIGSTQVHLPLAEAVAYYAIASATQDHRFRPVELKELAGLQIEISRLSTYRQAPNAEALRAGKDGVWLIQAEQSGLFLPQVWEQIPGKTDFLEELCEQKAALPRDCWKNPKTHLLTFTVEEFSD